MYIIRNIYFSLSIAGGQKISKVDFKLASMLFPFSWLSHFRKHKAPLWEVRPHSQGVTSSLSEIERKFAKKSLFIFHVK